MLLCYSVLSIVWLYQHPFMDYLGLLSDTESEANNQKWYARGARLTFEWLVSFITYVVAFSHLIPISLYVAIEVLKLFQAKMIEEDRDLGAAPPSEEQAGFIGVRTRE